MGFNFAKIREKKIAKPHLHQRLKSTFFLLIFFFILQDTGVFSFWRNWFLKGSCLQGFGKCWSIVCISTYTLKPRYSEQVCQNLFVHYIKCNKLSKSTKLELGFVHYIGKFTILRFVISRFECTTTNMHLHSSLFCSK